MTAGAQAPRRGPLTPAELFTVAVRWEGASDPRTAGHDAVAWTKVRSLATNQK
jgi:hypothetical protein